MTKKIDETQLIKDFYEGVLYVDMAIKHRRCIGTIAYRLRKLGLKRTKQNRGLFSAEEKDFMRGLMETYQGRKQLLNILRGE